MSMATAFKEMKECMQGLKKKYPGLPYYGSTSFDVVKYLLGITLGNSPDLTVDIIKRADAWDKILRENSNLSRVIGRDLDWIYEYEEASRYVANPEEFESYSAVFKGEMHSYGYILSELEKENSDLSCCQEGEELIFKCWREEIDVSDKWNPLVKKVFFEERVIPNNTEQFLKILQNEIGDTTRKTHKNNKDWDALTHTLDEMIMKSKTKEKGE